MLTQNKYSYIFVFGISLSRIFTIISSVPLIGRLVNILKIVEYTKIVELIKLFSCYITGDITREEL